MAAKVFELAEKCADEAVQIVGLSARAIRAAREVVECCQNVELREEVKLERYVFPGLCTSTVA